MNSHNDHRAAAQLSAASLRGCCILRYAVSNHLLLARFRPSILSDISHTLPTKLTIIAAHGSQFVIGRIDNAQLYDFNRVCDEHVGVSHAEPFELDHQYGAPLPPALLLNGWPPDRLDDVHDLLRPWLLLASNWSEDRS